jgi:hypothetical protein
MQTAVIDTQSIVPFHLKIALTSIETKLFCQKKWIYGQNYNLRDFKHGFYKGMIWERKT